MNDASSRPSYILVVDNDVNARNMVITYLEEHLLHAAGASGRQEMLSRFSRSEPTLVILDACLGEEEGIDVLQDIRSRSDASVIMVAEEQCEITDRIVELELGADDCLTRPFGLRELLARVRAVLRRREIGRQDGSAAHQLDQERGRYRFSGWRLDRRVRRLTDPDEIPVALTKGEYALLSAFLDSPQRPLSREQLLQATRVHEDIFDRSIDVQILRLRRKLETDPSAPRFIQTERGVGYLFAPVVERL
jgi:two-component system OmpR family response regulator